MLGIIVLPLSATVTLSDHQDLQGELFNCCEEGFRAPKKVQQAPGPSLKLIQLRDRGTTSTELAQEWQQAGVRATARTVRRRLLKDGLVSRRAAKKPLLSRKNIRDRLDILQKIQGLYC